MKLSRKAADSHSDEWFAENLQGINASDAAKRAAIQICRSYDIRGTADVGYIANVIQGYQDGTIQDSYATQRSWENISRPKPGGAVVEEIPFDADVTNEELERGRGRRR